MPAWVHRTTREYLRSIARADLPSAAANWIEEPNLSAVVGFASQYWIVTGDVVTLMSPAQRAAVDAAALEVQRDLTVAQVDQVEDVLRAFVLVLLDELNGHATKINAILTAIDNGASVGAIKTNILAIADYPARTTAQIRSSIRGKLGT